MRSDSDRNMSALLTRITRQVSRMFDLNKIKMKTGSMAYVMEHRLYGLFFCVMRSGIRRGEGLWEQKDGLE